MMLRRRMPIAAPGDTGAATNQSSSGPRWTIAAIIRRTSDSASTGGAVPVTPQMPHTSLLYRGLGDRATSARQYLQASSRHVRRFFRGSVLLRDFISAIG